MDAVRLTTLVTVGRLVRAINHPSRVAEKATSGFEPLLRENADGLGDPLEPSVRDVPELNPFLARVLERLRENERERSR